MKPNQAVIVAMHLLGLRLTSLLEIIITIKDVDINSRTILYKYNNGTRGVLFTGNIPRGVFCERRSQKTRDIPREFMRLA